MEKKKKPLEILAEVEKELEGKQGRIREFNKMTAIRVDGVEYKDFFEMAKALDMHSLTLKRRILQVLLDFLADNTDLVLDIPKEHLTSTRVQKNIKPGQKFYNRRTT